MDIRNTAEHVYGIRTRKSCLTHKMKKKNIVTISLEGFHAIQQDAAKSSSSQLLWGGGLAQEARENGKSSHDHSHTLGK
jgi:hypothetical protein